MVNIIDRLRLNELLYFYFPPALPPYTPTPVKSIAEVASCYLGKEITEQAAQEALARYNAKFTMHPGGELMLLAGKVGGLTSFRRDAFLRAWHPEGAWRPKRKRRQ